VERQIRRSEKEEEENDMDTRPSAIEAAQNQESLGTFLEDIQRKVDRASYKLDSHKKAILEAKAQASYAFAKMLEEDAKLARRQVVLMGWRMFRPNSDEDLYNQMNHRSWNVREMRNMLGILPMHWPTEENISHSSYRDTMSAVTLMTFATADYAKNFLEKANQEVGKYGFEEKIDEWESNRYARRDHNGVWLQELQDGKYSNQDHMFGTEVRQRDYWRNNGWIQPKAQLSKGAKLRGLAIKAMTMTIESNFGEHWGNLKQHWQQDSILDKAAFERGENKYICFMSFRPKDQVLKVFFSRKYMGRHEDVFQEDFEEKVDKAMHENDVEGRWMERESVNPNTKSRGKKGKGKEDGKGKGKGKFSKTDTGSRYPFRPKYSRVDDEENPEKAWEEAYQDHIYAIENPIQRL